MAGVYTNTKLFVLQGLECQATALALCKCSELKGKGKVGTSDIWLMCRMPRTEALPKTKKSTFVWGLSSLQSLGMARDRKEHEWG